MAGPAAFHQGVFPRKVPKSTVEEDRWDVPPKIEDVADVRRNPRRPRTLASVFALPTGPSSSLAAATFTHVS